jgi:predicted phage baseplate assembly protein
VLVAPGGAFVTASGPDTPGVRFEYAGDKNFVLEAGDWVARGEVFEAKKTLPVAEGRRITEVIGISDGTAQQRFPLPHPKVILRPAGVDPDVTIDDESTTGWTRQETLAFSGADQPHFAVEVDEQDRATVVFGDRVPLPHAVVTATYRVGGGEQGNVGAHTITTIDNAPGLTDLAAKVSNAERAVGGAERESIEHAVSQAPAVFRSLGRAVTTADYEALALAFGGVGKVRARALAGGVVRLTVAPSGGGTVNDVLRSGLTAYFEDKRAIGTRVDVYPADYVPIYVTAIVDVEHYFSNARIASQVREAVRGVLSFDRSDFGQTIYLSKFFEAIEAVDGVAGVNITEFATARQAVPVQEHGKIQLAETEVATVPEPSTPVPEPSTPVPEPSTPVPEVRPGWTPEDLASGVRVTASGGFQ